MTCVWLTRFSMLTSLSSSITPELPACRDVVSRAYSGITSNQVQYPNPSGTAHGWLRELTCAAGLSGFPAPWAYLLPVDLLNGPLLLGLHVGGFIDDPKAALSQLSPKWVQLLQTYEGEQRLQHYSFVLFTLRASSYDITSSLVKLFFSLLAHIRGSLNPKMCLTLHVFWRRTFRPLWSCRT